MRFDKVLCAFGLLALAATARAESEKDAWLIRTPLANPTPADIASVLETNVTRVEHVKDDLYRVVLAHDESGRIGPTTSEKAVLEARIRENAPGAITHIQRNHIYKIQLAVPEQALQKMRELTAIYGPVAPEADEGDNPAIQAPDDHPANGPDPKLSSQWGLSNVKAPNAWKTQRGDKKIIVAVIDTGVDYNHEDLRNNLWRNPKAGQPGEGEVGYDFVSDDPLPFDLAGFLRIAGNPGHGTHCSGVIGAVGDNALGTSGIAPNVSIMGVRFIDDQGQGTTANAVKAINWAVAHGAKILSNSWGGEKDDEDDTELKAAIEDAGKAGVLFVVAAGNGRNMVGYDNDTDPKPILPASYDFDNIVAVAATDQSDKLADFSNWGKKHVHVAAPGVRIMSTVVGSSYEDQITLFGFPIADWSGTSMATPHVAGAAALIWSQHPEASVAEVRERLLQHVRTVPELKDKISSGGVLDVEASVK